MPMEWNEEKVLLNIRAADTDDLLDRITAYRAGIEAEAIDLIEQELHRRGVTAAQIHDQAEAYRRECVFDANGIAKMCSICRRPAVSEGWGWHRILGKLPIVPCWMRYCKLHQAPP
jgi:hypothetical protein